jgi:hypothetical protein
MKLDGGQMAAISYIIGISRAGWEGYRPVSLWYQKVSTSWAGLP